MPSAGEQEIGPMMQAYAEQAVRLAQEFKVTLDYSEDSVQQLEALLGQLHEELESWSVGKSSPQAQPESQQINQMAKIWGGYLGEVVRRRFGGEWTIEKYPAGDFLIVTLNVNGARLFPSMKVHRRLAEGASENLWSFYQTMREKLLAMPGARVQ
jgi:hypothetical protein